MKIKYTKPEVEEIVLIAEQVFAVSQDVNGSGEGEDVDIMDGAW